MNDRYTKYYNAMCNYLAEKELKYLLSKVKTKVNKSTCLSLGYLHERNNNQKVR